MKCLWLLVFGAGLSAQDAGIVLRTSVTYNTQKATLQLTEEQRKQADELSRQAQQANQAGKYGDAMRSLYHGLAVMRKVEWTPAFEFASSLQGKLDHAIVEPGAQVNVMLTALYAAPGGKLNASLVLMPGEKQLGSAEVDSSAMPFHKRVDLAGVPPGDYTIELRLPGTGVGKSLPVHVDTLGEPVQRLRARLAKAPKKDGVATAEYALALYDRADAGELNPARVKFREEFAAAEAIVNALEAGKDPFAGKHGDSHRAYRSAVDNTLQPYRLFIPETYDGSKPTPLVVALHGMGGDENSMFDSYANGLLKREAERLGFMVVCPKGRDSASMYRGSAEQDVLDVLAEVRRNYRVDAARIYLMGHSMGAYGTWSTAMDHPDIFAALGPISGGGSAAGMVKIRHIPQYVVHGDDDRTVSVTQSRTMVEAGKKAGAEIVYVEVPGGSHVGVAAPAFPGMLDFFAKQKKDAAQ
uniref:Putative esterase n=1 Tax=Solibacter usitatus (strain Ellin6076) TaxID=234267 RepID=Q029Y4_SOLUE